MNKPYTTAVQQQLTGNHERLSWPIIICVLISASALIYARLASKSIYAPGHATIPTLQEQSQIKREQARAREIISAATEQAEQAASDAQESILKKIHASGTSRTECEKCADQLASSCSSAQNITKMLYLVGRERAGLSNKEKPEEFIQSLVAPGMTRFIAATQDEVRQLVQEYHDLASSADQGRAAKLRHEINEMLAGSTSLPLVLTPETLARAIEQQTPRLIEMGIAIGFESVFIRGTLNAVKNLFIRFFSRPLAHLAASGALVVADRSLQIGDIIAAAMTTWTLIEIRQSQAEYREAFKDLLSDKLHHFEQETLTSGAQAISNIHQAYSKSWQASSDSLTAAMESNQPAK
jgi:hypothetical protein